MTQDRPQRTALVCGGTSGLGLGISSALSAQALRVLCTSSKPQQQGAAGGTAFPLDFREPQSIGALIDRLHAENLLPDIVVINGPGPAAGYSDQLRAADWEDGFRILWSGPLGLVNGLVPAMKTRGWGRIIWVTSVAAQTYMPEMAISTSLRSGLHGLMATLSAEYAPFGITVNAIAPGYIDTEMVQAVPENVLAAIIGQIPVGRLGKGEEIADMVAFLAGEHAGYVTGSTLSLNGGQYMAG